MELLAKMEAQVDTRHLLSQPKGKQQFKNKKQPELTENRTVWKYHNQGDKEDTFREPRWWCRQTHCASSHNQKKDNNLKTKNNQNCQKVELYGSPTTKEIKKMHASRPVGGARRAAGSERTHGKVLTQRGGGLWNRAGQAAAIRPCGPTFTHR